MGAGGLNQDNDSKLALTPFHSIGPPIKTHLLKSLQLLCLLAKDPFRPLQIDTALLHPPSCLGGIVRQDPDQEQVGKL